MNTAPKIEKNKIVFIDHDVICALDCFDEEYMEEMKGLLTELGTAKVHIEQLNSHNNDGTWTVKLHPEHKLTVGQKIVFSDKLHVFCEIAKVGSRWAKTTAGTNVDMFAPATFHKIPA